MVALDGRWIAFVQGDLQYIRLTDLGNLAHNSIWLAPASGGNAHRITDESSMHASPAWISERSLLLVSDQEGGRDAYELSLARDGSPSAAPVRITTGLNPHGIAVSRDGSRLTYSAFTETSNVWSLPMPAAGSVSVSTAVPETQGNQMIENLDVSRDGGWLGYNADRGGTVQLYRARLGTKEAELQQVTSDRPGRTGSRGHPTPRKSRFTDFVAGGVRFSSRQSRETWPYR